MYSWVIRLHGDFLSISQMAHCVRSLLGFLELPPKLWKDTIAVYSNDKGEWLVCVESLHKGHQTTVGMEKVGQNGFLENSANSVEGWVGCSSLCMRGPVPPKSESSLVGLYGASSQLLVLCWKGLKILGHSPAWKQIFGIFCPWLFPPWSFATSPFWGEHTFYYRLPQPPCNTQVTWGWATILQTYWSPSKSSFKLPRHPTTEIIQ